MRIRNHRYFHFPATQLLKIFTWLLYFAISVFAEVEIIPASKTENLFFTAFIAMIVAEKIKKPLYVRYAWADNPINANLYNQEGLPASPFTTEK